MQERILWALGSAAAAALLVVALFQLLDDQGEQTGKILASPNLQKPIRVEILNGCGVPQVAARLTKKARLLGCDVIHESNARSFNFLHTLVIDRSGDRWKARQVAAVLGIPHCIQQIIEDEFRLADVSIIIGRDYQQINLFEEGT